MTTLELLRQIAGRLADQIEAADDEQLRRIGSAIAHAAVDRSGFSHPTITEGLRHLNRSGHPDAELQGCVQSLADQLDADYFEIQAPYDDHEDAGKSEPEVIAAFARARTASAVAAALGEIPRVAAAEAAYEAITATDDPEYFTRVAHTTLVIGV